MMTKTLQIGCFVLSVFALSFAGFAPSQASAADWATEFQSASLRYPNASIDRARGFMTWSPDALTRVKVARALLGTSFNSKVLRELSLAKQGLFTARENAKKCQHSLNEIYGELEVPNSTSSGEPSTYGLLSIYEALIAAIADSGASPSNFIGLVDDASAALLQLQLAVLDAIDTCGPEAMTEVCAKVSGFWSILSDQFMSKVDQWIGNTLKKEIYNKTPHPYDATYKQFLASPLTAFLDSIVDPMFALKTIACDAAAAKK